MPAHIRINFQNSSRYFWLFLLAHTLMWTLGPSLLRPTLPHDALEGITWGLQWQLGYNKHPFLTAWLCAGITKLFASTGWPVYFLAQIAVGITFIAVWKLAQLLLPKTQALLATLALEGVLFYNINSFNITPDTLQSPLWALVSLFFYQALSKQKISSWLCTALFAGLCVCTKYQSILLLLSMLLLCLFDPVARKSFKKPGIYCAIASFCLLLTPHLIWLIQNHFITLTYAAEISSEYTLQRSWLNHINYPVNFLLNNFINVIAVFILFWPFYGKNWLSLKIASSNFLQRLTPRQQVPAMVNLNYYFGEANSHAFGSPHKIEGCSSQSASEAFKSRFLIYIGLGPLLFSFLICLWTGDYFPARWSTPYFFMLGILCITYLKPVSLSVTQFKQFTLTLLLFSVLLFCARISTFTLFPRVNSDAFLPNQEIALVLTKLWEQKYHTAIPFLAGSHYLVAGVTPYLPRKAIPYLSCSQQESPWVNESELRRQGGLFIWDEQGYYTWDKASKLNTHPSEAVLERFPALKIMPSFIFSRLRDKQPIRISVAILPPEPSYKGPNK